MINRRSLLLGTAVLTSSVLSRRAFADEPPVPIIFVHGDSDQAAIWQTVFWRFESNGCPLDRLFAINFANPQARDDDGVAQPNRSSTQDELRELADFVDAVRKRTGADKVALVALSRGGYSSRSYIASAGAAHVSRRCSAARPITASSRLMP
jgi:pimeloyl-ACP methyl ester carboxylesterase